MSSFRTLTPPKFVVALRDREKPLLLEERLQEFVRWLEDRGIKLYPVDGPRVLRHNEIQQFIKEYVEE